MLQSTNQVFQYVSNLLFIPLQSICSFTNLSLSTPSMPDDIKSPLPDAFVEIADVYSLHMKPTTCTAQITCQHVKHVGLYVAGCPWPILCISCTVPCVGGPVVWYSCHTHVLMSICLSRASLVGCGLRQGLSSRSSSLVLWQLRSSVELPLLTLYWRLWPSAGATKQEWYVSHLNWCPQTVRLQSLCQQKKAGQ